MSKPPINVLLVTADQMRADCLSAAGHPLVRTPVLDRLAAEGLRFSRHFGQALPCGPARTSLLTGMYAMNHRAVRNGTPLDVGFTNLAQMARSVGYLPWLIGYTDSSLDSRGLSPADPLGRYEEHLLGLRQYAPGSEFASGDSDWKQMLKQQGYPHWQMPFRQQPAVPGRGPSHAPSLLRAEHSLTAYTADRAIRFFDQFDGWPWFLHVSFLAPHPPLVATAPWHEMYRPEDVPGFAALASLEAERAIHPFMPFRLERLEMNPVLPLDGPHPDDNPAWRQARASYFGLISELDHHLGRMFEALRASGQYDNTLIVFTSDHGEMLGDRWCWGKETPFDQAVRVPLIIRAPDLPAAARGRVVDAFTEHVDLMPTILERLGAEIPLQCDGRSLMPFIEGGAPERWRDAVRWELDFRSVPEEAVEQRFGCSLDELSFAVVRTDTEKYVHFAAMPPLYYDLETDPMEFDDRAGDPGAAARQLAMAGRMLDWRMAFNRRELTGRVWTRDGGIEVERRRRIV